MSNSISVTSKVIVANWPINDAQKVIPTVVEFIHDMRVAPNKIME